MPIIGYLNDSELYEEIYVFRLVTVCSLSRGCRYFIQLKVEGKLKNKFGKTRDCETELYKNN